MPAITGRGAITLRRYHRGLFGIACAAVAISASLLAGGTLSMADGWLFDLSVATRSAVTPVPDRWAVAVVALDHRSLEAPELRDLPRVFLAPYWARMLDALFAAGARAVAFDVIFAYSANRFRPDYDRPFLEQLSRHRDRVVLATSAKTRVADPLFHAAGGSVGYAELAPDADGVYRRVTATVRFADGTAGVTLAAAALARAGAPPMPAALLLAPRVHLEAIPSYSLIDVVRCAAVAPGALVDAFADRIVLVGTTLAEEGRKPTSDRFLRPPPPDAPLANTPDGGCALQRLGASYPESRTVPGVFVHAATVDAVATGRFVTTAPPVSQAALAGLLAFAGTSLGFMLRPWWAALAALAVAAGLFAMSSVLLDAGLWVAVALPAAAHIGAATLAYVVRFLVEDRRRLQIQRAFSHYLAPRLVDRLVEDESELRLGGERREVSVMFADLSGFTALSGRLESQELMEVTNRYLGELVAAVEATGGYVNSFVGDAVMGIWGAPASDADHAINAVRAAFMAVARIDALSEADTARGRPTFSVKIGINSGQATVGNVGAEKRYNYTAVGEIVNIASRLESLPSDYACRIVVGPLTAERAGRRFVLSELDWIRLLGKTEPISVFEPLCDHREAGEAERTYVAAYEAALKAYRAGRLTEAAAQWRTALHPRGGGTTPATVMAQRAAAFAASPPGAGWDAIWTKTSK
jgi:class 3 adenylate cyclase/CHASE2 domain-containing sensor protein